MVLVRSIDRQGNGYGDFGQGDSGGDRQRRSPAPRRRAASKEQVLAAATRLVDDGPHGARRRDVGIRPDVRHDQPVGHVAGGGAHYAAAQDAASNGKFEEARDSASEGGGALDPKFGVGYQLAGRWRRATWASCRRPRSTSSEALASPRRHDRARALHARAGTVFRVTGDYQQCVKEYGELIARYAADVVGHNQLALCSTQLRDMPPGRRGDAAGVVDMLPNRAIFRDNLALYANYAGDFQTGGARGADDRGAGRVCGCWRWRSRSWDRAAAAGDGDLSASSATIDGAGRVASRRPAWATWRRSKAVSRTPCGFFEQGAAADLAAKNADRAAAKFAALAYAQLSRAEARRRSPPPTRRWRTARPSRSGSWRRASFVEAGETAESAGAHGRPRRRAPGRAAGLRQDHRRRDRAEEWRPAPGDQDC